MKVLSCTGNYYYSDQEILKSAHVGSQTRLWLTPSFMISNPVQELPLIDTVDVIRSSGKLEIHVQEKKVIGYYVNEDSNYALTQDGDSIKIDADDLAEIIHFPLLSGFTKDQREQIARQFKEHAKDLSRSIIEKMAEIIPYESSYDDNMLQITMQDGNKVYTTLEALYMISNYPSMLNQLEGHNVCLILDKENSAIEKINCDQLTSNKDDDAQKEESKEQEEAEAETKEEEITSEDPEEQEETQEEATTQEPDPQPSTEYIDQTQDWQTDPNFGLQYSATLDMYYDPGTGIYYRWNDTTLSFDVVN